jgi:hypothetical protein
MIWAALSWYSAGPVITLIGGITSTGWVDNLREPSEPDGLIVRMFHDIDAVFQDDSLLVHVARSAQSWFEEREEEFQHLPWPA